MSFPSLIYIYIYLHAATGDLTIDILTSQETPTLFEAFIDTVDIQQAAKVPERSLHRMDGLLRMNSTAALEVITLHD